MEREPTKIYLIDRIAQNLCLVGPLLSTPLRANISKEHANTRDSEGGIIQPFVY